MCMKKTYTNMDSHSYKNVHDETLKQYGWSFEQRCAGRKPKIIWIVIHTEMCMTKTKNNMDSRSYRENQK